MDRPDARQAGGVTWTPEETARKLDEIRAMPAGELLGWWGYVHGSRAPFEGEIFALRQRAATLKMTLPPSSPGGPSATTTGTAPQPPNTGASTPS